MPKFLLFWIDCAECRTSGMPPLLNLEGVFETLEEAQYFVVGSDTNQSVVWKDYSLGGVYFPLSSGDWIILPSDFAAML